MIGIMNTRTSRQRPGNSEYLIRQRDECFKNRLMRLYLDTDDESITGVHSAWG